MVQRPQGGASPLLSIFFPLLEWTYFLLLSDTACQYLSAQHSLSYLCVLCVYVTGNEWLKKNCVKDATR